MQRPAGTRLKRFLFIAGAALALPLAALAQTYKVGDRYPGGGLVLKVDASGKSGVLIDEVDSGPYTPSEAAAAAKAKGWSVPGYLMVRHAYRSLHLAGKGNFKPALYQSHNLEPESNSGLLFGINFSKGLDEYVYPRIKTLVRFVKPFDATAPVATSVFPLSRVTGFEQGRKYPSPSGQHYLIFQSDGNLVVYTQQDKAVWALSLLVPNWQKSAHVVFQPDGNLAVYQADKGFLWSARMVASPAGTTLTLNDKGELQIVGPDGKPLWTGTAQRICGDAVVLRACASGGGSGKAK